MNFHEAIHLIRNHMESGSPLILYRNNEKFLNGFLTDCNIYPEDSQIICDFSLRISQASSQLNTFYLTSTPYPSSPSFHICIEDYKIDIHVRNYQIENNHIDVSTINSLSPMHVPSSMEFNFSCSFVSTDFDFIEEKGTEPILTRWEILDL